MLLYSQHGQYQTVRNSCDTYRDELIFCSLDFFVFFLLLVKKIGLLTLPPMIHMEAFSLGFDIGQQPLSKSQNNSVSCIRNDAWSDFWKLRSFCFPYIFHIIFLSLPFSTEIDNLPQSKGKHNHSLKELTT